MNQVLQIPARMETPQTAQSIQEARAAQFKERQFLETHLGLTFDPKKDGQIKIAKVRA